MPDSAPLFLRVYDGTRELMAAGVPLTITLIDGLERQRLRRTQKKPALRVDLPYTGSTADRYRVLVSAKGWLQAGFAPVALRPGVLTIVDLMLLPRNHAFSFREARWDLLPEPVRRLAGEADYTGWLENRPETVACLLNITTAMRSTWLPVGTPLDYVVRLERPPAADRFFAWADPALLEQVEMAAAQEIFEAVPLPGLFHPGATRSWKQVEFGEANLQLTFHEQTRKQEGSRRLMLVEADMDYYRDPLAHALLEVLPNSFGGRTDPRQIYVLRWIAGRRAGVAEFAPPYTIVPA